VRRFEMRAFWRLALWPLQTIVAADALFAKSDVADDREKAAAVSADGTLSTRPKRRTRSYMRRQHSVVNASSEDASFVVVGSAGAVELGSDDSPSEGMSRRLPRGWPRGSSVDPSKIVSLAIDLGLQGHYDTPAPIISTTPTVALVTTTLAASTTPPPAVTALAASTTPPPAVLGSTAATLPPTTAPGLAPTTPPPLVPTTPLPLAPGLATTTAAALNTSAAPGAGTSKTDTAKEEDARTSSSPAPSGDPTTTTTGPPQEPWTWSQIFLYSSIGMSASGGLMSLYRMYQNYAFFTRFLR